MKVKEELASLRELDVAGLEAHLSVLLKEQFELRLKNQGGQLPNNSKLTKVRKAVARAKTIIRQKQLTSVK